eukprot:TRINITY_DN11932_c0_g1_i2.p1 TRINITY_DN11932_c0_g1~~TRINITY_DN11932_c0_g1_i2.p1  ORF type:complete len:1713 (+),score=432.88 TRINITY_DN11932_c0_g1_i2:71-5140(+)
MEEGIGSFVFPVETQEAERPKTAFASSSRKRQNSAALRKRPASRAVSFAAGKAGNAGQRELESKLSGLSGLGVELVRSVTLDPAQEDDAQISPFSPLLSPGAGSRPNISIAAAARRVSTVPGGLPLSSPPTSPAARPAGVAAAPQRPAALTPAAAPELPPGRPRALRFDQAVRLLRHADHTRRKEQAKVDAGEDPWPWMRKRDKEMWFADGLIAAPRRGSNAVVLKRGGSISAAAGSRQDAGRRKTAGSEALSSLVVSPRSRSPRKGDVVPLRPPRWKLALALLERQREAAVRETQGLVGVGPRAAVQIHRFVKWFKQRHMQRKYEAIRDEYNKELQGRGFVTDMSDLTESEMRKVDYRKQADQSMNDPEMLRARIRLRDHRGIHDAIQHMWAVLPHCPAPHDDKIDRQIYQWMSLRMMKMFATSNKERIEACQEIDKDWFVESNGEFFMDYPTFFECMFSLLDVWVDGLDPPDYIDMMHRATECCASRIGFLWSVKLAERHWDEWLQHTGHAKEGWWTPAEQKRTPTTLSPEVFPYERPKTFVSLKTRASQVWGKGAGRRSNFFSEPYDTEPAGSPLTGSPLTGSPTRTGTGGGGTQGPVHRRRSSRWQSAAPSAFLAGGELVHTTDRKRASIALQLYSGKEIPDEEAAVLERRGTLRAGWAPARHSDVRHGVLGVHRVRDGAGQWWPCLVRGTNADGTYVCRVYDGNTVVDGEEGAYWPRVPLESMQVKVGEGDDAAPIPTSPSHRMGRYYPPPAPGAAAMVPGGPRGAGERRRVRAAQPPGPAMPPVIGASRPPPPPNSEEAARAEFLRTTPVPALPPLPPAPAAPEGAADRETEALRDAVLAHGLDFAARRFPLLDAALQRAPEALREQYRAAFADPRSFPLHVLRTLAQDGAFVAPHAGAGRADPVAAAGGATGRGWEVTDESGHWWPCNVVAFVPRRGAYAVELDDGAAQPTRWDSVPVGAIRKAGAPPPTYSELVGLMGKVGALEGRDGRGVWWPVTLEEVFTAPGGARMARCTVGDGRGTVWEYVPLCALRHSARGPHTVQLVDGAPRWSYEVRDAAGDWWPATVLSEPAPGQELLPRVEVLCGGASADCWTDVPLTCLRVRADHVTPGGARRPTTAASAESTPALGAHSAPDGPGAAEVTPAQTALALSKVSTARFSRGNRAQSTHRQPQWALEPAGPQDLSSPQEPAAAAGGPLVQSSSSMPARGRGLRPGGRGSVADFRIGNTELFRETEGASGGPQRLLSRRSVRRSFAAGHREIVALDLTSGFMMRRRGRRAGGFDVNAAVAALAEEEGDGEVRGLLLGGVGLSTPALGRLLDCARYCFPNLELLDIRQNPGVSADAVVPVLRLAQSCPTLCFVRAEGTALRLHRASWGMVVTACTCNIAGRVRLPGHLSALRACAPAPVAAPEEKKRKRPRWNRVEAQGPAGVPLRAACEALRTLSEGVRSPAVDHAGAWRAAAAHGLARKALRRLRQQLPAIVTASDCEVLAVGAEPPSPELPPHCPDPGQASPASPSGLLRGGGGLLGGSGLSGLSHVASPSNREDSFRGVLPRSLSVRSHSGIFTASSPAARPAPQKEPPPLEPSWWAENFEAALATLAEAFARAAAGGAPAAPCLQSGTVSAEALCRHASSSALGSEIASACSSYAVAPRDLLCFADAAAIAAAAAEHCSGLPCLLDSGLA